MFWRRKLSCPITNEDKIFVEQTFNWIIENFGNEILEERVLVPEYNSLGFTYSGTKENAFFIFEIISKKMRIDSTNIQLNFYKERNLLDLGDGLVTQYQTDSELTAGRYIEYNNGEVEILIEENQLNNLNSLIATIAHELVHYKLLHENRLSENNEFITDIVTIVFGLGIFGANTSVVQMSTWSAAGSASWQIKGGSGYLHFKVWGYALAYYCLLKNDLHLKWYEYLEKDVLIAFNKSIKYMSSNVPNKE